MQAAVSAAEAELKKSGVSYTDIEKAKIEAAAGFGAASAQISSGQSALNSAQTTLDSNKESLDSAQDQITELGFHCGCEKAAGRRLGSV